MKDYVGFMPGNTIERIAYALEKQDSSWLTLLSKMSTKEILEARYEEDTVLSLLIGATVLFPKKNRKIREALSDVCRSVYEKINTHKETPVVGPVLEKVGRLFVPRQVSTEYCGDAKKAEEDVAKLSATFPHIAKGISIIAKKFEDTRSTYMWNHARQEDFCRKVEKFLQLENVEYVLCGRDEVAQYKKSCTYTIALQYFFYTSCPEMQLLLLEPIKALLLGFSRYALDKRGARSIHYALSMCGGVCEEEFYSNIVSCLLQEEERYRNSKLSVYDERDGDGNTLLHYALSSVYCSPRVLYEIVTRLEESSTLNPNGLPITEILIANIPYYALFFSLECMNTTKKDTLADANRNLRELVQVGEFSEIRQAVERLSSESKNVHAAVLNLSSAYEVVLGVVYGNDYMLSSLPHFGPWSGSDPADGSVQLLRKYSTLLSNMCEDSDIESDERDSFTHAHMKEIFGASGKKDFCIGARDAAKEVASIMLENPKYIRKASITAGYSKNARGMAQKRKGDGEVNDWIYDVQSIRVNRYLAAIMLMGKKSISLLEGHSKIRKETVETIKVCNANNNICMVGTGILVILSLALLASAAYAIGQIVWMETRFKIGLYVASITLGATSVTAGYLYCIYEKGRAEAVVAELVGNFDTFAAKVSRKSADLLECINPYTNVALKSTNDGQKEEDVTGHGSASGEISTSVGATLQRGESLPDLYKEDDPIERKEKVLHRNSEVKKYVKKVVADQREASVPGVRDESGVVEHSGKASYKNSRVGKCITKTKALYKANSLPDFRNSTLCGKEVLQGSTYDVCGDAISSTRTTTRVRPAGSILNLYRGEGNRYCKGRDSKNIAHGDITSATGIIMETHPGRSILNLHRKENDGSRGEEVLQDGAYSGETSSGTSVRIRPSARKSITMNPVARSILTLYRKEGGKSCKTRIKQTSAHGNETSTGTSVGIHSITRQRTTTNPTTRSVFDLRNKESDGSNGEKIPQDSAYSGKTPTTSVRMRTATRHNMERTRSILDLREEEDGPQITQLQNETHSSYFKH